MIVDLDLAIGDGSGPEAPEGPLDATQPTSGSRMPEPQQQPQPQTSEIQQQQKQQQKQQQQQQQEQVSDEKGDDGAATLDWCALQTRYRIHAAGQINSSSRQVCACPCLCHCFRRP